MCVRYRANNFFLGCIISVVAKNLVDIDIQLMNDKDVWDVLESHYEVSDARSELYIMELVGNTLEVERVPKQLVRWSRSTPGNQLKSTSIFFKLHDKSTKIANMYQTITISPLTTPTGWRKRGFISS